MAAPADFTIKAHDRLPPIQATLGLDDGSLVVLTGCTVKFVMALAAGGTPKVAATAVIVDAANGVVRYDWLAIDTNAPGEYLAEWEVTDGTGKKRTYPTDSYHSIEVLADLDNA